MVHLNLAFSETAISNQRLLAKSEAVANTVLWAIAGKQYGVCVCIFLTKNKLFKSEDDVN